jgi:hypothetical protein
VLRQSALTVWCGVVWCAVVCSRSGSRNVVWNAGARVHFLSRSFVSIESSAVQCMQKTTHCKSSREASTKRTEGLREGGRKEGRNEGGREKEGRGTDRER